MEGAMLAALDDRRDRFADLNERAAGPGAAEEWRRANGRPPTAEELDRLLRRYPGNPMVSREDGLTRRVSGGYRSCHE